MNRIRNILFHQSMICLLVAMFSSFTIANAAGLLTKAKEKQVSAVEVAAEFIEKVDALVKATVAAEVAGDIVPELGGESSNYATLTVPIVLSFKQEAWNAMMPKIEDALKELSQQTSIVSFPFRGDDDSESERQYSRSVQPSDDIGTIWLFRGLNDDKSHSEWERYTISIDVYREVIRTFGDGYVLYMTINDADGGALKSENRVGLAMPAFRIRDNLFLTPFLCNTNLLDLPDYVYANMTETAKPITDQFQFIIEKELLDRGDDIVFSVQRKE